MLNYSVAELRLIIIFRVHFVELLHLYAPVSQIQRKSMFNIHFLPIILLCFFTKTAFWGTCFGISASFFRHFRGS